jgi:hypothetical protein
MVPSPNCLNGKSVTSVKGFCSLTRRSETMFCSAASMIRLFWWRIWLSNEIVNFGRMLQVRRIWRSHLGEGYGSKPTMPIVAQNAIWAHGLSGRRDLAWVCCKLFARIWHDKTWPLGHVHPSQSSWGQRRSKRRQKIKQEPGHPIILSPTTSRETECNAETQRPNIAFRASA